MDLLIHWISNYGYAAIYLLLMVGIVGLPIPDETILLFTGYLVAQHHLQAVPALIVAFLGSASGITLSYVLGRTLGLGVIHRFGRFLHVTEERLERVHAWFRRIGHWAIFAGYWIAGVRHFTAIIAGASCLEFRAFAGFAYSGALLWVATFLAVGYYFGEHWREVSEMVDRNLSKVSIAVILIAAVYVAYRAYRARRKQRTG
jgi:membrane protein DedA with SNARE-associated domain